MARNSLAAPEDWRIENDLRTLLEAEKIQKDPKRLKAARELAKKKPEDMMSIAAEKD